MLSSKGQASLERFGFGTRDEAKNPLPPPLPFFGPQLTSLDAFLRLCICTLRVKSQLHWSDEDMAHGPVV